MFYHLSGPNVIGLNVSRFIASIFSKTNDVVGPHFLLTCRQKESTVNRLQLKIKWTCPKKDRDWSIPTLEGDLLLESPGHQLFRDVCCTSELVEHVLSHRTNDFSFKNNPLETIPHSWSWARFNLRPGLEVYFCYVSYTLVTIWLALSVQHSYQSKMCIDKPTYLSICRELH